MALPVKLQDVVFAMDVPADGWASWINRRTGEIVSFSEDDVMDYEDDDKLHDWQVELVAEAKKVEASEDFIQLPDKYEIHDYAIMERFCHTVDDDVFREDLLDTIKGSGAFRRFRRMIDRRGLEQAWYGYRAAAYDRIAADFLELKGISFVRT